MPLFRRRRAGAPLATLVATVTSPGDVVSLDRESQSVNRDLCDLASRLTKTHQIAPTPVHVRSDAYGGDRGLPLIAGDNRGPLEQNARSGGWASWVARELEIPCARRKNHPSCRKNTLPETLGSAHFRDAQ